MSGQKQIDEEGTESDLVHERRRESPFERCILLDGNWYVISGLFAVIVFLTTASIGLAGYVPGTDPGTGTTLVAAIVGGIPCILLLVSTVQVPSIASRRADFGPIVPRVAVEG